MFNMDFLIFFIIALAILLDVLCGELPSRIHPVVWMGQIIQILKPYLLKLKSRWSGFILTSILTILFVVTVAIVLLALINKPLKILDYTNLSILIYIMISGVILSTTFSIKMLINTSKDVAANLEQNTDKARHNVSYLVSRNTKNLDESQLISATIESLTENITDSITSPILFAFVFGVPGAIFFRVVNTLDAMVGYKNEENAIIGWFPAKLDDLLNYIPARLTGFIIILSALTLKMDWKNSLKIMLRDARVPPSPNSGYTMAAAAGALGIKLEKPGVYVIGDEKEILSIETIYNALKLTKVSVILFLVLSFGFFTVIYLLTSIILF